MQGENSHNNGSVEPMKIFFLIDELNIGGTEKQLVWLCEKLPRSHFSPTIGVLRKSSFQASLRLATPVVDFNWAGLPLIKNFLLLSRLRNYLAQHDFDIFQTQFVESEIYGFLAALWCAKKRPKLISTRRNLYHWISEDIWRFRIGRHLTCHVDHILVNSHAVQNRCQELEAVPADKITVIQNAVALERFQNGDLRQAKEKLGLAETDFVVGVVGNWRPVKGMATFLAAAEMIAKKVPNARFILAGQGPQEQELREAAQTMGLDHATSFIKDAPDVSVLIAAMDVAVQPSLSESFSNVLLEYMAAGKAIVATGVGDASAMLKGGDCGLLVAPEDPEAIAAAVLNFYEDQDKARSMGQLAKERATQKWSETAILASYQEFYSSLLQGRGGHGRDA